jgi:hypothetical protein
VKFAGLVKFVNSERCCGGEGKVHECSFVVVKVHENPVSKVVVLIHLYSSLEKVGPSEEGNIFHRFGWDEGVVEGGRVEDVRVPGSWVRKARRLGRGQRV